MAAYQLSLGAALDKIAPERAVEHLRAARALAPGAPDIDARMHKPLMEVCAWDECDAERERLLAHVGSEPPERWSLRLDPFLSLVMPLDPAVRKEAARCHALRVGKDIRPFPPRRARAGSRMRIGYVAAEFRNHATAHVMAGLLERHDRSRFEVLAYSFGADDGSEYGRRTRAAFDRFVDIGALHDAAAAQRIAADEVDILLDLKGYTAGARPGIFAYRPAPLQVNYLGYPGSMQCSFIDYVVADATVLPERDFGDFSEAPVWLPASYQPNDDRQPIAEAKAQRSAHGLPEDGFVYCCFNRSYKIEREIFSAWMAILSAVPGSVLWLLADHGATRANLEKAAARAGVDPARLVFASRQAKAEHLARHRLADLFLDTHTCCAHTTASDALWAGLPLLAWPGDSFAGRVAASLLRAVGLPELITGGRDEYERTAVALARHPGKLHVLRARLAENRLAMPLFRTEPYTRQLEAALLEMQARSLRGEKPEAFAA